MLGWLAMWGCTTPVGAPSPGEAPSDTSMASIFASPPVLSDNPNPAVPLAAILTATTSGAARLEVEVSVAGERWVWLSEEGVDHQLEMLGFIAGLSHELQVTALQRGAREIWPEVLVFDAPPVPTGFPDYELLVHLPDRMEPGYTMLAPVWTVTGTVPWTAALDAQGRVVWWLEDEAGGAVRLMPDGQLMLGQAGTRLLQVDWLGDVQRAWHARDEPDPRPDSVALDVDRMHHDLFLLPDDGLLTLAVETRTVENFPTSEDDPNAPREEAVVASDVVLELDLGTGEVRRRWAIGDLLDPTRIGRDALSDTYWAAILGPGVRDWSHANSIWYDAPSDTVVVSLRHQDAVVGLSRTTGELLWILAPNVNWGPALADQVLAPAGTDFTHSYHQHAAKIGPEGTVLLFDNHNHGASAYETPRPLLELDSRAVEYAVDLQAGTQTQLWSWTLPEPNFESVFGDFDLLGQTGNALITYGDIFGGAHAQIIEVDRAADEVVFHLRFTQRQHRLYRSERIDRLGP